LIVEGNAADQVAENKAYDECQHKTGKEKGKIPKAAPFFRRFFAAEFNRCGSQHKSKKHAHERCVEVGSECGKNFREGGKENTSTNHNPR
jgi:hypothetical protein